MKNNSAKNELFIGCVADDFTGASDIASFFSLGGLKVVMFNELPEEDYIPDDNTNVIVIALKIRDINPDSAVDQALKGFRWLQDKGAEQYFFKYCSTFDSTPRGNIGPIIDSLLEEFNAKYTIISPALPINGRTVKNGHLLVNDIPLQESYMKNHPITPMWSSKISELLKEQGKYNAYDISVDDMENEETLLKNLNQYEKESHFYLIPDYYDISHGALIIKKFGDLKVLTGSSGLAYELGQKFNTEDKNIIKRPVEDKPGDSGIVISGSCSVTTQKQIETFISKGNNALRLYPESLLCGDQTFENIMSFLKQNDDKEILIYSFSENRDDNEGLYDQEEKSKILESTMGRIGIEALRQGINRIIVAGGETSGAVIKRLDYKSFIIGESISPGVPVLIPEEDTGVRLVLKSGNFGDVDFFEKALRITGN